MDQLPDDVIMALFLTANNDVIYNLCRVNSKFNAICNNDYFWQLKSYRLTDREQLSHRESSWKNYYKSMVMGGTVNILTPYIIKKPLRNKFQHLGEKCGYFSASLIDTKRYSKTYFTEYKLILLDTNGIVSIIDLRGQRDILDNVVTVSPFGDYFLYLRTDGTLYCDDGNTLVKVAAKFPIIYVGESMSTANRLPIIDDQGNVYLMDTLLKFTDIYHHTLFGTAKSCLFTPGYIIVVTIDGQVYINNVNSSGVRPINFDVAIISVGRTYDEIYVLTAAGQLYKSKVNDIDFMVLPDVKAIKFGCGSNVIYYIDEHLQLCIANSYGFFCPVDQPVIAAAIYDNGDDDIITYLKK